MLDSFIRRHNGKLLSKYITSRWSFVCCCCWTIYSHSLFGSVCLPIHSLNSFHFIFPPMISPAGYMITTFWITCHANQLVVKWTPFLPSFYFIAFEFHASNIFFWWILLCSWICNSWYDLLYCVWSWIFAYMEINHSKLSSSVETICYHFDFVYIETGLKWDSLSESIVRTAL